MAAISIIPKMARWPLGDIVRLRRQKRASSRFSCPASGRQRQRLQFLPSCAKSAKLIDRCASRRERERVEWPGQHLVQIGFRSDADRHMRIETLARRDRTEVGDVLDQGFLNVASAIFAE